MEKREVLSRLADLCSVVDKLPENIAIRYVCIDETPVTGEMRTSIRLEDGVRELAASLGDGIGAVGLCLPPRMWEICRCSSVGRAADLKSARRRFDSGQWHQSSLAANTLPLAGT